MLPTEAGFDGSKGIRMPLRGENFRVLFKRGTTRPSDFPEHDFTEQLCWWMPPGEPAQLLWCNADDQWFELSFTPIDKP